MIFIKFKDIKDKEPSYAIPGFGGKGRGAAKTKDMKSKGTARQLHTTLRVLSEVACRHTNRITAFSGPL